MVNEISRRSFLGLGAASVAGLALAGCSSNSSSSSTQSSSSSKEKTTIRLAVTASGHIFNAIAEQQGYLEEEGVVVEQTTVQGADEAFQALFGGKIDITSTQGTNLPLTHIASGQDLVVWAGYMITGCMPVIARTGTGWNGVEDIVGKTIICNGNEFAVLGPLCDKGYKMNEDYTVTITDDHNARVEAVATGKADYAILGTGQMYNVLQKDNVEIVSYCSDITPNYSCCRVNSTSEFLNKNEEAAKGLLRAWLRAQEWYEQNKDATVAIVAKQIKQDEAYVRAYMDNEHYRLNLDPYKKSVVRAWNWMDKMGIFPDGASSIKVEDHIRTDIYKAALDDCTSKYGSSNKSFYDNMNSIYKEYDA